MVDSNIQLNNTRNTLLLCLAKMVMRKRHNVTLQFIAYLIKLLTESKEIYIWSFETCCDYVNPLNAELNHICYLLALLAHHFLHVSSVRVKSLTLRLLISYIYIYIYIYIWSAYS